MTVDRSILVILLLSIIVVATTSFTVPSFGVASARRTTTVTTRSTPLYVSDEAETASSSASTEVEEATPELTPEEEASRNKRKIQRERHTLFVGNLPFDASEDDLKELFEQYGTVQLMTIPKDNATGRPRGFSFIDMATVEECQAGIDALDGTTFGGRTLRVNMSVPKDQLPKQPAAAAPRKSQEVPDGLKKIYMGNIPFEATVEEITELYEEFGPVKEVFIPTNQDTGVGRGFAFVTMDEENADKAMEATNGMDFGGRTLVVNEPLAPGKKAPARNRPGRTKLYVGNLSYYTVPETLEDLFGEFGDVYDCYLPEDPSTGGSRGFGFVSMAKEDAERAIAELDECEVDGRVIRVNEAQPKGGRKPQQDMDDEELDVISSSWEEDA